MNMFEAIEGLKKAYPGRSVKVGYEIWNRPNRTPDEYYTVSILPGLAQDCTTYTGATLPEAIEEIHRRMRPADIAEIRAKVQRQLAELDSITKGGENVS